MASPLDNKIEFLKGVGPQKAAVLNKELGIFTFSDLLHHFPYRHEDKTRFYKIAEVKDDLPMIQVKGELKNIQIVGEKRKQRLTAQLQDDSGVAELIWFRGINWVKKYLNPGYTYVVFAKPSLFKGKVSFAHPEIELFTPDREQLKYLYPMYTTSESMKRQYLDSKGVQKLIRQLIIEVKSYIRENLSADIIERYRLVPRAQAFQEVHFPVDAKALDRARFRLKFEELFFVQLKLLMQKGEQQKQYKGFIFEEIPSVTAFYNNHLPFDLTGAQKRVIKEIRRDFASGKHMNRLLQGDVGSGKTIVAFICMLMAIDNASQACLMAPTEILAEQHYRGLSEFTDKMGIKIELLTGSTKQAKRKAMLAALEAGELNLIVGTHALLEDRVKFKRLGLCIIDEQHRFGVAQRAKLWNKNRDIPPHVLVMTATPIPRTLAMTVYGDLDISVIDELPKGRKPIKTIHRYDSNRLKVFGFVKEQVKLGRQVYIVYPLIEESEKMDYKDLMDGYESVSRAFPEYQISIVHGKMKAEDKEYEMQRFLKKQTQIMVATTVIEVGVNVPNASVMIIENAERFGLAQLHQLRGRVGRGAEQSYCILMTGYKLSRESKIRIDTMVRTNNGFEIADVDLRLRGPGDLSGTQQSGVLDLSIADLSQDGRILTEARNTAMDVLEEDYELKLPKNQVMKQQVDMMKRRNINWSKIS